MRRSVLLALGASLLWATSGAGFSSAEGPDRVPLRGTYANAVGCTWDNGCVNPTKGYHGYPAIDFTVGAGTAIHAAGPGVVEVAHSGCKAGDRQCGPRTSRFGNSVAIRHLDGSYSWYAHLAAVSVNGGDTVERGHKIGTSGSTGFSFGPHLHYEERGSLWGARRDPGSMNAKHGDKIVTYPSQLGYSTWSKPPCGVQSDEPGCEARHTIRNDGFDSVSPPSARVVAATLSPTRQQIVIAGVRLIGDGTADADRRLRRALGQPVCSRDPSGPGGIYWLRWGKPLNGIAISFATHGMQERCGTERSTPLTVSVAGPSWLVRTELGTLRHGVAWAAVPRALRRSSVVDPLQSGARQLARAWRAADPCRKGKLAAPDRRPPLLTTWQDPDRRIRGFILKTPGFDTGACPGG